ncbi:MAG: hypothetical protein Q9217_006755 [Psora testacea]
MANLPPKNSTASFWHSEPSEVLLGHRTSLELPPEADVAIIGSGITGASVARYLSEDARAKNASNGGHCQPLLFDSAPEVAAFEVHNYDAVESYIREHNVPCEWRSGKACRSFWTQYLFKAAAHEVEILKDTAPDLGDKIAVVRGEDELRKYKVNGAPGATITTGAASLWPYKLIAFMLEQAIKDGRLNLQTNTPVTNLEACSAANDGATYFLSTPRGNIRARHVVLATNAYTSHLLPEFADLIVPERGFMSALLPPKNSRRLAYSYGFVGANNGNPLHDDYLNQRPFSGVPNPSAHLMFGGGHVARTTRSIGETDDSVLDEGSATYLRRELLHLLTLDGETQGVEELQATHQWSGIWGVSKDRHPWVGGVPGRKGVWVAGGYSGHGMPNGTLCGKAVVEMLLGEESGAPAEYVIDRLVATLGLPRAYLITEERIERCSRLDSVMVQEEKSNKGYRSAEDLVKERKEMAH